VEDEAAAKPEFVVPAGTPVRVSEWLVPPMILVGLAVIEIFAVTNAGSRGVSAFSIVVLSLLFVVAAALWIFGYRAYRDLTEEAVDRYVLAGVGSLFVTGILLSFGTIAFGWIPLVWSGRLLARRGFRPVRLVRSVMPSRLWLRTAVIVAVVGVICLLLMPLAVALGFVPLIVLVMVGRIVAPFVFGFAFRLRPGASGMF
jgi:hypothetical protein